MSQARPPAPGEPPTQKQPAAARVDLFTPIHKALRRLMFDTAVLLGQTDFASASAAGVAQVAMDGCLGFLREHAEHEDHHLVPAMAITSPDLVQAMATEHPDLERAAIAAESLWPRLAPLTSAAERAFLGAELTRRFNTFVAAQLRHMDREEREGNRVFWAHATDGELQSLRGRILGDIAPARLAAWQEIITPALSPPERALLTAAR